MATIFPSVYTVDIPGSLNTMIVATKQKTQPGNFAINLLSLSQDPNVHPLLIATTQATFANMKPGYETTTVFTDDHAPIEWIVNDMVVRFIHGRRNPIFTVNHETFPFLLACDNSYTLHFDRTHLDNIVRMTAVLAAAKKSFGIRVYPDAPHGFSQRHHAGSLPSATEDAAWNQIVSFLKSVFAGEWKKDRAIWRLEADSSLDYDFSAMQRWE